ncbi:MAG: leucine--tRNA ligase [Polyangiaceae bacterium]|nr:leucine--tRNA ligase [Polyangiaceae bacterium]
MTDSNASSPAPKGKYDHAEVEPRWQKHWEERQTFRAARRPGKKKRYLLDMFPYPSGSGLHVGHPEGYTATDIVARYARMRDEDVLHPMGWDAFGLPAEQYAIETGTHPSVKTYENIATFRRQLKMLGFSYDWSRELATTDDEYVRWTQWIFLLLFKRGLAYQDEIPVNWCPALGTVLANEEVVDGRSERGNHPVIRTPLRQWMLRITAYADRLAEDLSEVDWPHGTLTMQREWIGRSEGAEIEFSVDGRPDDRFSVFTTRADTLLGVTFVVLAPEHPLVKSITTDAQRASVDGYVAQAQSKSDRDRIAQTKTKTGVPTGAFAIHPLSGEKVPVWVGDYVIGSYGTGAVMGVPGHDARDFEFAKAFKLAIVEVVSPDGKKHETLESAYVEDGIAVNSGEFDGLKTPDCSRAIVKKLESIGKGRGKITYKLRDWVFSRQRYWGEPIPIYFPVELPEGGDPQKGAKAIIRFDKPIAIEESELPLRLPNLSDFRPGDDPAGPLARSLEWRFFQKDGQWYARETNTMPQWAGSCWYYLRFLDPKNGSEGWSKEAYADWMPVDLYVGGAEHAVLHLLYARFWHKVLYDAGFVRDLEPFKKLVHQGMILGTSYRFYRSVDGQALPGDLSVAAEPTGLPAFKGAMPKWTPVFRTDTGEPVQECFAKEEEIELKSGDPIHRELGIKTVLIADKMSKSRGNVVNPDDIVKAHGADCLRLYEMFMGPLEAVKPWQSSQIQGVVRFRDRAYAVCTRATNDAIDPETERLLHRTIKKVTQDVEGLSFNTAISTMMVFTNHLNGLPSVPKEAAEKLALLLAPFAPHVAEEIWKELGHPESLALAPWPSFDPKLTVDDKIEIAVQVNGKVRGQVLLARTASEEDARKAALEIDSVKPFMDGKTIKKFIYVPARIVNFVVG